jgi:pimeloyl-ACP methyl ester carboxylesterase
MSPKHPTWQTVTDIQDRLSSLQNRPLLLCWGMKDFCFTPHFLDRWLEFFPNAQVRRFNEDGHYLLEDAGDEVIREILSFLQHDKNGG